MQKNKTTEKRFKEKFDLRLSDGEVTNILAFISQERKQWEDDLQIGDLRQWLNEKPKDRLIKDMDIKIMLGLKSKEEPEDKPFNVKKFIKDAREVKKTFYLKDCDCGMGKDCGFTQQKGHCITCPQAKENK